LSNVLQSNSNSSVTEPERDLNEIYIEVLRHSILPIFSEKTKAEFYAKLKQMLGIIVVLLSPLSTYSLSKLLNILKEDINETLENLHAILEI